MSKLETIFNQAEADYATGLLAQMPASSTGKPMKLLDWEIDAVSRFYGTQTEDEDGEMVRAYQFLYLELTKKQGKTEIAAGLAIEHLLDLNELNAEVYIVAADRDNAGICFNAALYKIRNTPALARLEKSGAIRVRESTRRIDYVRNNGVLRVLSAEAESKHGYKPSCVIFDELHAQPNRKLWDVMTFGAGDARRQPTWIVLTTAGDDPDRNSIGWEVHRAAVEIRDARRLRDCLAQGEDPAQLPFLRSVEPEALEAAVAETLEKDNPRWLPILYGLSAMYSDDDDLIAAADIYDEALWRAVNPSIGTTVKLSTIRTEAQEAKKSEAKERLFRWLRLNQWIATKSVGWLPLTIYDKTQWNGDPDELLGKRCYGGLDLSSTSDLTAFVLYFPPQAGLDAGVTLPWAWVPDSDMDTRERRDGAKYRDWARAHFMDLCPGDTIDYEAVKDKIAEAVRLYDFQALGVDPYLSRTITQELQSPVPGSGREPVENIIEIPQTISGIWPAMWEMEQKIRKHEMLHVHNTAARYCFGNVRCSADGNGNLKPMKNRSRGRIDITVATIIAVAACLLCSDNEPSLADLIQDGSWTL